jgi:hypothetical protein
MITKQDFKMLRLSSDIGTGVGHNKSKVTVCKRNRFLSYYEIKVGEEKRNAILKVIF